MAENPLADFVNLLNKEGKAHASTSVGTDITLASHVPYGIPTRMPQLDLALGRPGFPAGRIIELFGFEGSGKTTAALHALAATQAGGGLAHFIDTEFAFDPIRARQCGVNPDSLVVTECSSIEAIFRTIESSIKNLQKMDWKKPYTVVTDSVTAVMSENEMQKEIGEEARLGQDARTIRMALRKLTNEVASNNICALFVNHSISKIGVTFGKKSQSAGGHALKFWGSVRVQFSAVNQIFEGTGAERTRRGQVTDVSVEKNKVSKTNQVSFKVPLVENGFDLYTGLFEALQTIGDIEKVNQKTYFFKPTETQVTRADWPALVDSRGGPLDMYKEFLQTAQERGFLIPYGTIELGVRT